MYNTNMVDFSKIFNIVFVSACALLSLVFLISVIAVAAKGKRKCCAGDVILRIFATIVLLVSAAMVAAAVLTMLTGKVTIAVAEEPPAAVFAMGDSVFELPLPELFVALSTVIGFGLSAVLFMLSLTALIVDCLVANKKGDKAEKKQKKEPAVKKSPEQLKREAELERIKRIGDAAVRKTTKVAGAESSPAATATEQPKQEQPAATEPKQEEPVSDWREQSEPATDWRETPAEPKGFVGLKDEQSDFDSFDSFDSFDDAQQDDGTAERENEFADSADNADYTDATDDTEEEFVEENAQSEEVVEQATEDGAPQEDILYDDDEQFTYAQNVTDDGYAQPEDEVDADDFGDGEDEQPAIEEEQAIIDDEPVFDEEPTVIDDEEEAITEDEEQPVEQDEYEPAAEDVVEEDIDESQDEDVIDESDATVEVDDIQADEVEEQTNDDTAQSDVDIEPDRGIYIPEMRTVTPRATAKPETVAKAAAKKPAAKKPAKKSDVKTARPGKSGKAAPVIPPEKKLPVRRRYIILDRNNAVNMFGEYLKERNQAEKDKLKSSINTIIIE